MKVEDNFSSEVPFTENDVKQYLDNCIQIWRKTRDMYKTGFEDNFNDDIDSLMNKKMAMCYIDAFQSVRSSLFGEVLPVKEKK